MLAASLSEPLAGRGDGEWGRLAGYAVERGLLWAIVGAIVAAAVAAAFGRSRLPLGQAVVGAGAGWLGGAAGGAGYVAMKQFGQITEQDAHWLLVFAAVGLPAIVLARVLARAAGASVGECMLAALAGAVVAALLSAGDRTTLLTAHVLLVVGAVTAVLAAPLARRAPARRSERAPRPRSDRGPVTRRGPGRRAARGQRRRP